MILGYWGIKGRVTVPKFVAHYCGVEYQEHIHADMDKWFKEEKENTGLDFPNLPYIKDGDFNLTESSAIAAYIANKGGNTDILGKTAQDRAVVRMIDSVVNGIWGELFKEIFKKDTFVEKFQAAASSDANVQGKADQLAAFIGDKEFILGYFSLADIIVAVYATLWDCLSRSAGAERFFFKHENIKALSQRVFALPKIKEFIASDEFAKRPWLPPHIFAFELLME